MPDYIIKSDAKQTSTLGKVKVLVEQVVGAPSQEAINTAVAEYIEAHPGSLSPLSPAVKAALLQIAEKVAYVDENGQDYYDALEAALNATEVTSISAVFTQGSAVIYDTDNLDKLRQYLVVTALYDDGTDADVTDVCTLSGTLTTGTSVITAEYGGKTASFNVTVTHNELPAEYTRIEYVQRGSSVGTSSGYNTTGVTLNGTDDVTVEIGFMNIAKPSSTSGAYIVGARQNNSGNSVGFGILVNQDETYVGAYDGTLCSIEPEGGASIRNKKYDLVVTKTTTGLTVTDGTHTNTTTGTPRAMASALTMFGIPTYNNTGIFVPIFARLYYLTITEGGTVKANLIPCKRKSDSAVGFYDTVQEAFRTAQTYTAGPEVG